VAISLFLLTSLAMVYTAPGKPFGGIDASQCLMVRRLSGIVHALELRRENRSRAWCGASDAHELGLPMIQFNDQNDAMNQSLWRSP
jgi:hypothetical protein